MGKEILHFCSFVLCTYPEESLASYCQTSQQIPPIMVESWQPLGKTLLKVKPIVGPTCKIPRSTQRSCLGIRRSPKMCQGNI